MKIFSFTLGQLQANCYFVINEANHCLIIDPADEVSFILEEIQRRKLIPLALLATHGHFDHIMAAGEIQRSFIIPFYIHKKDLFLVDRLVETAEYFLNYKPVTLPVRNINYLKEGELKILYQNFLSAQGNEPSRLNVESGSMVENWSLKIVFTPGHTPGSVCFYFENEKILFSGDTLFKGAIGRYDFSYSSKKDLDNSLKKILQLPADVVVYPGHGESTTIEEARNFLHF
jgi:glyoxylase-like metal-dependent hydrolase (beta-lactamase superfamily II)